MNIILIGPPGSGKGTQAFVIAEKYDVKHISTGDLFRDAIKNETPLGKEVKSILREGALVPDELTFSIVDEAIQATNGNAMLDGYPRTVPQAQLLDDKYSVDAVIYFEIAEQLLIDRLTGRRVCRDCGASFHVIANKPKVEGVCDLCGGELYQREDDNVESAQVRLKEYFDKTTPVIEHYSKLDLLYTVDASKNMDEVTKQLNTIFEELK